MHIKHQTNKPKTNINKIIPCELKIGGYLGIWYSPLLVDYHILFISLHSQQVILITTMLRINLPQTCEQTI